MPARARWCLLLVVTLRPWWAIAASVALAAPGCGGEDSAAGGSGPSGTGGAGAGTSSTSSATGSTSTGTGSGGGGALDLCDGLVTDTADHPMTPLAQPGLLEAATDPEFGTTIRRVSDVGPGGVIKPMYSTISGGNADESRLILYEVDGGHRLHDGKTYAFLGMLDIDPADLEQVYWHTTDPDVLFYVSGKTLVRYHVGTQTKEPLHTFASCAGDASGGDDPMFMSWDSNVIGVICDGKAFSYRVDTDTEGAPAPSINGLAPQASASGERLFFEGGVFDLEMNKLLDLDLIDFYNHASLGRLLGGHDTYNGVVYDPGPNGSEVGALVVHDMTDASARVVIGPMTGYPYPPGGVHLSALAYQQPGWVFLSIVGDPAGQGLLDSELLVADTNPGGKVCRIAHHRSFGGDGAQGYWAEPHVVPSPSGTRALFGSDWGDTGSVDAFVVELPSYVP